MNEPISQQNSRIILYALSGIGLVILAVMMLVSPIPQDPNYHNFADARDWLGIPNFGDVVGNLPFIIFGLLGGAAYKNHALESSIIAHEATYWRIFFLGAVLVGFGSAYYHWSPSNASLVWDRLPMTIAFMSFFAFMIADRLDVQLGRKLLLPLLIVGAASVFYWDYTESLGHGDLRPYALVQFLPMLIIPLLLLLRPSHYDGTRYFWQMLGWYVLAKTLEHFDIAIFHMLGGIVSGHTLKHLASSMAILAMARYVMSRTAI